MNLTSAVSSHVERYCWFRPLSLSDCRPQADAAEWYEELRYDLLEHGMTLACLEATLLLKPQ